MGIAKGVEYAEKFTTSAATHTTTVGQATQATGSAFLVFVIGGGTITVLGTPTDNKGNTYLLGTAQVTAASGAKTTWWYCENGAGGAGHIWTSPSTGSDVRDIIVLEIPGGALSGIVDQVVAGLSDLVSPYTSNTTGAISQANEMIVAMVATDSVSGTEVLTWGNGFVQSTAIGDANFATGGLATQISSAIATFTSSFTSAGAGTTGAVSFVATFKEAATSTAVDSRGSDVTSRNRPGRGPRSRGRYRIRTSADTYDLPIVVVPAPPPLDFTYDRTGTRDNRPGRGPYSLGRYFRPRDEVRSSMTSVSYALTCDAGSYALTGQTVALARGRVLPAAQGSYAITGQAVGLARGRVLTATQGSYVITGQTVGLARGRVLPAAQGAYALTGQIVGLTRGRVLAATQGAYALTGQTVLLTRGRVLGAAQGSYVLSGQAVTLTPSGSHAFTITTAQGSYVLTGQSVGLPVGRKLAAAQGLYALTGQSIAEHIAHTLAAGQGSYALTGMPVVLSIARRMAAAPGAYSLAGQPIAERVVRTLVVAPGAYAITGQSVGLSVVHAGARALACAPGVYVISGKPIVLTVRRRMSLELGLYVLTGQPASLVLTASIFSGHQPLFHTRPEFLAMGRVVLQFFGEPTQYFAGSGAPTQPRGVFFDPYTDVNVGTPDVQSVMPFVWYLLADLPADPQEIPPVAIIIRGKSYKPKEPQKDSDGGVKIELQLSS